MISLIFTLIWLPIRLALTLFNLAISVVLGLLMFCVSHFFLTLILVAAIIVMLQ